MPDIVVLADLKTALRITDSTYDTELTQILNRVEKRFQGEIGQTKLVQTTYTGEKYSGDGTTILVLRKRPLQSLTSIAIEDESAITHTDVDVLRYVTGIHPDSGTLELVNGRVWTRRDPFNITVTYSAGYVSTTISSDIPDVWELLLDTASQLYTDMDVRRKGVSAQTHMSGAVTYFTEGLKSSSWYEERWEPVVRRHKRWVPVAV